MLPPEEQERFIRAYPDAFAPVKGAWGRRGNTRVVLEVVDIATLRQAMVAPGARRHRRAYVNSKWNNSSGLPRQQTSGSI